MTWGNLEAQLCHEEVAAPTLPTGILCWGQTQAHLSQDLGAQIL